MKMKSSTISRRKFISAATTTAAIASIPRPAGGSMRQPNVLVIVTDQHAANMLSCTGNPWLKTPALDSLAATGTRFERAYSSNPVCLPARFSFQTGHYPSAAKIRHNHSEPDETALSRLAKQALGHQFRTAGYETCYGGKVHLPGNMEDVTTCGYDRVLTEDMREGLTDACVQFLEAEHQKPFLLFASFINPHDICYMAPRDLTAQSAKGTEIYQIRCIEALARPEGVSEEVFFRDYCPPLPANHEPPQGEPEAVEHLINLRKFRARARGQWTGERWREHRWAYCRLTERVDAEIGRVLDALDKAGLAENTIVLFTSDHGDHDASHKLEHKTIFYEEAARIPLVIRVPGVTRPGSIDTRHLVCNGIDMLPTLCGLCGLEAPEGLRGANLEPLLAGRAPHDWRTALLIENEAGFMVHTGRYKFARFDRCVSREWFGDLGIDPGETRNLIDDPRYTAEIARHRTLLAELMRENGASLEIPGARK